MQTIKHYSAAGIETDTITLNASDDYPESRMFTAWQHSTGQTGSEIEISNKCSKQLYKLMSAEKYGACQFSSECRCDECQSSYFDCDFDSVSTLATTYLLFGIILMHLCHPDCPK